MCVRACARVWRVCVCVACAGFHAAAQAANVAEELHARAAFPPHIEQLLKHFPKEEHPMTQLSMGVLALQSDSQFAKNYAAGMPKAKHWEFA